MAHRNQDRRACERDQEQYVSRSFSASAPPCGPAIHRPFDDQLPQYFLVRPDVTEHTVSGTVIIKGPMVPLIPVDQLPPWLEIVGVPRALDLEQMKGLKNLGEIPKELDYYEAYLLPAAETNISVPDEMTDATAITQEREQMTSSARSSVYHSTTNESVEAHNDNDSIVKMTRNKKLVPNSSKSKKHGHRKSRNSDRDETSSESIDSNDMSSGLSSTDDGRPLSLRPSSSNASAVASTTGTEKTSYRLRPSEGIRCSRHAVAAATTTTTNNEEKTKTVLPPFSGGPAASVTNPQIPSSPRSDARDATNIHTAARFRGGPILDPNHPAARMLKTFTPAGRSNDNSTTLTKNNTKNTVTNSSGPSSPSTGSYHHHPHLTNHNSGSSGTSFCRHWCHHNTCKWQAACKYRHEMPQTVEGLREVGLVDWPMWYKAQLAGRQNGLALGMFWREAMAAGHYHPQHHLPQHLGSNNHALAGGPNANAGGIVPPALLLGRTAPAEPVMSPKEIAELRERLERQELEEKRAKLARESRLAGRTTTTADNAAKTAKSSNNIKRKDKSAKDIIASRLLPRNQQQRWQDDDYDSIADESLEATFRRAAAEDREAAALQMRLKQANNKAKDQEQVNLLDL